MNKAEKQLFIKKLGTDSDDELAKTIHYYRGDADLELLPPILELLTSDRSETAKGVIIDLCSDIREQQAADIVFGYMAQTPDNGIKRRLMSSLWQTGLDFSHKAPQIVELICSSGDFETVFEAFTLLENSTDNLSPALASELHDTVSAAEPAATEEVRPLYAATKEQLLIKMHQDNS